MFRTVKNATASLALIGLVMSAPAMAVRSSDSLPSANVTHVDARVGTPMGSVENLGGHRAIGWLIGGLIVAAVVVIVVSDHHHHNKSPG